MASRDIMSASSTSSATLMTRSNYEGGEFNIWNLIKRRTAENAFCLTCKFRVQAKVHRIQSASVTRQRRPEDTDGEHAESDGSSTESSDFGQDWDTLYEEDDDLEELYEQLSCGTDGIQSAGIVTLAAVFSTQHSRDDVDLGIVAEVSMSGTRAQKIYLKKCGEFQITPSRLFVNGLVLTKIDITRQNIGPKGAEACAIALTQTSSVRELYMNNNSIGHRGAKYIALMLKENQMINTLGLSDNLIGGKGAAYLSGVFSETDKIHWLDLSNNGFKEEDAPLFKHMLEETRNLRYLNLSHNHFLESGGQLLGEALSYNDGLEELDISWNHFRRTGPVGLVEGLLDNTSLKRLDASWNGFYLEGCMALQRTLTYNITLETIDLTNNRINRECIDRLTRGLTHNTTLHTLILKFNPLTEEGAYDILQFISECPSTGIQLLDLGVQQVETRFVALINEIHMQKRQLTVFYGHVIGQVPGYSPDLERRLIEDNPSLVLIEFGKIMGFRLMDLFSSFDKDGSRTLSKAEIMRGLKMANIPFSDQNIDALVAKLDVGGDGKIDFSELLVAQQEHRKEMTKLQVAEQSGGKLNVKDTLLWRIRTGLQKLLSDKMSDYATFKRVAEQIAQQVHIASDELEAKRETITRARALKPRKVRSRPTSPISKSRLATLAQHKKDNYDGSSDEELQNIVSTRDKDIHDIEEERADSTASIRKRYRSIHLPVDGKDFATEVPGSKLEDEKPKVEHKSSEESVFSVKESPPSWLPAPASRPRKLKAKRKLSEEKKRGRRDGKSQVKPFLPPPKEASVAAKMISTPRKTPK